MRLCPPARVRLLLLGLTLVALDGCAPRTDGVPEGAPPPTVAAEAADPQAPTGGVNDPRWRDAPYVVLLSLDGFAASYMHRLEPSQLLGMARQGVWAADGMLPSYPSKTFPNHYTLATGLYPAHHGIVANTFWDPAREALFRISDREVVEDGSWWGGEPLWVTAERQGMVAASFFWVGSEADVGGVRPSHWRRYDEAVANETRVDQVLTWLAQPDERRPHLILFYFSDTDDAGHRYGPDSPELAAAVARVDRLVGRLRMGLRTLPHGDRVHLLVVSDHGMQGYTPADMRYLSDVTPVHDLRLPERGPSGNLWVDGGPERVEEVKSAINGGLPGVTAYRPHEVPQRLHYRDHPRMGDLVLVTDSAVMVHLARPEDGFEPQGFTHGWDPAVSTMRALFVAEGPLLPQGVRIAPFENVHVYPLVTRLLGLEPAGGIDGSMEPWKGVVR